MSPALIELPDGRRLFTDEALQAQVDRALDALPADKQVGVVAHAALDGAVGEADLSIVARVSDGLTVMAAGYARWQAGKLEDLRGEAALVWAPW